MNILWMNWRDINHPRKGGAEVLTFGIFKGLVDRGHRVTWFTGAFPGGADHEVIGGVNIVRRGTALTVRAHAYAYYRQTSDLDVVVDEVNTLPFMTPVYSRTPVVACIHQLAREVWFYEAPPGIAQIGYAMEPLYLRPYRQVPTLTLSASSESSLRNEMGFTGRIGIMPLAIDQYPAQQPLPLEQRDHTIVSLGRVTSSKRLDQQIEALALLRTPPYDRLRLQILGGGTSRMRESLRALAQRLGVEDRVEWTGFVSETEKRRLLAAARLLVMTSVREGWGLAVSEANLAGTPAVGYDILGLKDSIKDGLTGLLTEESPSALAQGVRDMLDDGVRYSRIAQAAQNAAQGLTWEGTTSFVERFLRDSTAGRP
ncbi:MAG: glycosyltransferase [Candidatus Aquilonibacter sp.]